MNKRHTTWNRKADTILNIGIVALKVQCKRCKCKIFIPAYEEYRLCCFCGNKIINNSKAHFMYKMRKMKGVLNEENEKEN